MNPKLKSRLAIVLIALLIGLFFIWTRRGTSLPYRAASDSALNTRLPDPHLPKESWWSKMDFYKQAEKDSSKYVRTGRQVDSGEVKVFRSLAGLRERVEQPVSIYQAGTGPASASQLAAMKAEAVSTGQPVRPGLAPLVVAPQVLTEAAPTAFPRAALPPDPELQQLGVLLDKVLAIQRAQSSASSVTPLTATSPMVTPFTATPLMAISPTVTSFAFSTSGLTPSVVTPDTVTAIPAVTETDCTLTSGAVLTLRTTADARWHGLAIPRGTLLYGTATLEGERLHIRIKSVRMGNVLGSLSLEAYDQDGIEGVYIPGVPARDDVQTSADGLVNGVNVGGYTAAGQVAGAGVQTLKSLFSKKMREVRVTVRADYAVWLK